MRTAFFEGIACATDEAPSLAAAFGIPTQHGGEARRRSSGDGKEREGTKESEGSKGKSGEERQVEAAHYVGLWLRYRGPVTRDDIHQALAPLIDRTNLDHMLDSLAQDQRTIEGRLLEGDETDYVCDRRNYEFALRRLRARRSTEIETRPLEHLALDLVRHQGLLDELRGFEGLLLALESLGALPIAAELWESDILPARIRGYQPLWLDRAAYEESVTWIGAPNTHIALLLHGDIELYQQDAPLPSTMIPSDEGHYTFDALRRLTGKNSAELCDALWSEAWQGRCSNDAFAALRSGVTHGYHPPSLDRRQRGRGRATGADMLTGRWYATPPRPNRDLWKQTHCARTGSDCCSVDILYSSVRCSSAKHRPSDGVDSSARCDCLNLRVKLYRGESTRTLTVCSLPPARTWSECKPENRLRRASG